TGKEYLQQQRQCIDRQIQLGKKRGTSGAINKPDLGQLSLLEISPCGCQRIKQDENKQAKKVRRATDAGDALHDTAANRSLGVGRRTLPLSSKVRRKKTHTLRRNLEHGRTDQ